ncbi:MAG: hypothetical protein M1839_005541 [Geoglossum umbratile]|nr:MAG: hypothetical protein M1839_005541 [Geoglossum umbratile]
MNSLRIEADEANTKVEDLKAKIKALEQENLQKEQEITSLSHRNQVLEAEVDKLEVKVKDAKAAADEGTAHGTLNETLQRKLQILEEEAEEADKNLRETNDKLRQTDVKAGHYERKVAALEASRDQWETKYEEMSKKFNDVKKELDEYISEIGSM